jgi:hypothetical protein
MIFSPHLRHLLHPNLAVRIEQRHDPRHVDVTGQVHLIVVDRHDQRPRLLIEGPPVLSRDRALEGLL